MFPESSNPALRPVGAPPDVGWFPDARLIQIQKWVAASEPKIREWRKLAIEAYRFRDGKQLSDEDERALKDQGRPTTAFNTVQKFIRYVSGVQRESPITVLFNAIDLDNTEAQMFGERVGKYYEWARQKSRAENENARVFEDLLTVGMGWQRGAIGRAQDPRGLVILPRLNPLTMGWDVSCDRINLGGVCSENMTRYRWQEDWYDIEEAKSMFTSSYAQFLLDQAGTMGATVRDWPSVDRVIYKIPYVQTYPIDSQVGGSKKVKKDKVQIMEFQWWENEQGFVYIDPLDHSEQWATRDEFDEHEQLLKGMGLEIKDYAEQPGRKFQKAFLLNRRHFLEEPSPIFGDPELNEDEDEEHPPHRSSRFSFNCMCSHFDEESRIWYGFMRALMDPQRWANAFFRQTIELYGRQAKGGALATSDAFEDKSQMTEFVNTYAQPGKVNIVADINQIKEKDLPETPAAALTILKFIQDSMPNITGIATDAIGSGAGTAVAQTLTRRQRAGMVLLATEFDCEADFRKDEALITYDLLQEISDDRLIRVGGAYDGEVLVLSRSPYSLEYEIELDEVERDPNIRQWLADLVMGPFGQTAMRMGKWLPDYYNVLPIPRRWIEKLKQQDAQQAQQAQQFAALGLPPPGGRGVKKSIPMQQAETQNKQADTMLKVAKAKQAGGQAGGDTLRAILDMLRDHQELQHKGRMDAAELQNQHAQLQMDLAGKRMDMQHSAMKHRMGMQQMVEKAQLQQMYGGMMGGGNGNDARAHDNEDGR